MDDLRGKFTAQDIFDLPDKDAYLDSISTGEVDRIHQFEAAGLGAAPFQCVGVFDQPSNCQYCGASIRWNFIIQSADGREFIVGSDCVEATGDEGMIAKVRLLEQAAKKAEAEKKAEATRAALDDYIANRADDLALHPHPKIRGLTLLDYAIWMRQNAGPSGQAKVLKLVQKVVEQDH